MLTEIFFYISLLYKSQAKYRAQCFCTIIENIKKLNSVFWIPILIKVFRPKDFFLKTELKTTSCPAKYQQTWWNKNKSTEKSFFSVAQLVRIEAHTKVEEEFHKVLAQGESPLHVLSTNKGVLAGNKHGVGVRVDEFGVNHAGNLQKWCHNLKLVTDFVKEDWNNSRKRDFPHKLFSLKKIVRDGEGLKRKNLNLKNLKSLVSASIWAGENSFKLVNTGKVTRNEIKSKWNQGR